MQKSGTRPYSGIFTPLLPGLGVFLCVAVPLAYWSGAYDPGWAKTWLSPWPDDAASLLSVLLFAGLLLIPLCWVIKSGAVDLLALGLAQQALIFSGYFFLAATAARVEDSSRGILQSSGLVVLINAVGFLCFFLALGFVYHLAGDRRCRVCPPRIPPAELDRRLLWLNRALLLGCAAAIALPMILTGTVPLLSSGEAGETRMLLIENGLGRAVYHVQHQLLDAAQLCKLRGNVTGPHPIQRRPVEHNRDDVAQYFGEPRQLFARGLLINPMMRPHQLLNVLRVFERRIPVFGSWTIFTANPNYRHPPNPPPFLRRRGDIYRWNSQPRLKNKIIAKG
jgi:hypothetical protein